MARMFFDDDADVRHVQGQTACIVGYGNQGRSQALNLRDSGGGSHRGEPPGQLLRERPDGWF